MTLVDILIVIGIIVAVVIICVVYDEWKFKRSGIKDRRDYYESQRLNECMKEMARLYRKTGEEINID